MGRFDADTKQWTEGVCDEIAVRNGCRFNPFRGELVCRFSQTYLRLYEGDSAGLPLVYGDWQFDVSMRLFGWEKWSEFRKRWVRRFTEAYIFVPKKNAKTPTAASWGLYLTMADGENSQNLYCCAKDGTQSRETVGRAAFELVQHSPALLRECKLNKVQMMITHLPTNSRMFPLSGGNAATAKTKEGLNGSALIDEAHVVDEEYMGRIKGIGIQRSEPMILAVSSAGQEAHGYGRAIYLKGKEIQKGNIHADHIFFRSYEAPQTLTPEKLALDPLKYGAMANPSWGRLINPEEFQRVYNEVKYDPPELNRFFVYRLGVWRNSANAWLNEDDWKACGGDWKMEDFAGKPCWIGGDLSKSQDMTAIAAVFKHPEHEGEYVMFPYFWMTEASAIASNHLVPFVEWGSAGHLTVIPGRVIEQEFVETKVLSLAEMFLLQEFIYDPTFAADLGIRLAAQGVNCVSFAQTTLNYAPIIEDYERLIITGRLHHANHPVLNWQAGHCEVHQDSKGRKTLVKPNKKRHLKIDGMVASVMGLNGAKNSIVTARENFYANNQVESG